MKILNDGNHHLDTGYGRAESGDTMIITRQNVLFNIGSMKWQIMTVIIWHSDKIRVHLNYQFAEFR